MLLTKASWRRENFYQFKMYCFLLSAWLSVFADIVTRHGEYAVAFTINKYREWPGRDTIMDHNPTKAQNKVGLNKTTSQDNTTKQT